MIWIFFGTILILAYIPFFMLFLLPRYRKMTHVGDFSDLITILQTIVRSEIEMYENDIFENKRPITNTNFDNFYEDLCNRIIRKLSPEFMHEITYYVSDEMVISMIARTVKQYLVEKVPKFQ